MKTKEELTDKIYELSKMLKSNPGTLVLGNDDYDILTGSPQRSQSYSGYVKFQIHLGWSAPVTILSAYQYQVEQEVARQLDK
jgi:hypothetical protein